ncbi:hypothetical protein JQ634_07370 [Bradyrhizobium sp. AUGA SZCCT0240]|uniref:hypothetical protein n=1 Tax=unclassified Bradyrhizobium TaxID=2631580 RepID=UPI001BAB3171|nr:MULTISPECIES: hypothetical protein [unclassified Bradyrhizobium]MBR1199202.1 hypothetical protein [Bradyrhizobium sp. AUGA SZCCT0158]MBR1244905.1 hypothetical protein [Bradyrhizobium sp. AUGA SZCCT0274]MBR1253516.1 hypothetical protein [Bradyrhizobium sp. AUGA SZCCT0240]
MADEAFALSPISARAALPGEEDYAAISEAFMETSRGRWFLGEYAKRNRNADTSMVLDAVARIEQSLAAQKEESLAIQREAANAQREAANAQRAAADAVADNSLAEAKLVEALIAIRGALEAAQTSAMGAIDGLALNEKLAPVRKGARVIREIAWRLREIGNDSRICDLIDSQVQVIEKGAEQISSDEAKAALEAAFASLAGRIAEFSDEETPAPVAQDESPAVAEMIEESPASQTQAATSAFSTDAVAPAAEAVAAEVVIAEAVVSQADAALEEAETAETAGIELTAEAADAHDEAVLDMIAMEMGAPDPIDDDEFAEPEIEQAHIAMPMVEETRFAEPVVEEAQIVEPLPTPPEIVAALPEPMMSAPVAPPVQPPPQPVAQAMPEPALEVSLGSSIIASGIVRRPVAANDPLAPIRRMSQAEKIAFFS